MQTGEDWLYEITVPNPGRLPVDDVSIKWIFALDVQRVHYNGEIDPAKTELTLYTPVLAGGEERSWRRQLRLPFEQRRALRDTTAEVTFTNIDQQTRTNRWPRSTRT